MNLHFFYLGASDDDFPKNQGKGGETEDPYMRLMRYGTSYFGNNKFRFRFIVSLKDLSKKQKKLIESAWLNCFEEIASDSEEDGDLNQASTIEGIKYNNFDEVKQNFINILDEHNVSNLLYKFYETSEEINGLLKEYRSKKIKSEILPKNLSGKPIRDYQNEDIQSTLHAFVNENITRGYWDIECGLGKTIMAIELILRMGLRQNLFIVPRNTLLHQVLETLIECNFKESEIFVCNGVKNPENFKDIKKIKNFKDLPKDTRYICLTTYDSLINLKGASLDLTIFDEAHHLVPSLKKEDLSGNLFGLSDTNIKSKYRLFITGTVKDTNILENGEVTSYRGMSHQPELYGVQLAKRNYSFGLNNGYLSPFETIYIKTTQEIFHQTIKTMKKGLELPDGTFTQFLEELKKWEQGRQRNMNEHIERIDDDDKISADTILWYGIVSLLLIESIFKYNSKRAVTYHTTIARANLFTDIFQKIWSIKNINKTLQIEAVSSYNSETVNTDIKDRFKKKEGADIRILSNIRTLIEGFDEPSIDTTVFVDNKWSPIEAKQIIGRGNRKDPNNDFKQHKVLIPFIAYESYIDENTIIIKTTNDYKTVRYTIKNIILSDDLSLTISQTVWVPKTITGDTTERIKKDDDSEIDPNERIEISDEEIEIHDSNILGVCLTNDLAEKSFQNARIWTHALVKKLGWNKFTKESQLINAWNHYKDTHVLPKDIPCDPSKVYKSVGWIHWRDYAGILTIRNEWQEIKEGELVELFRSGIINPYDCTLSMLKNAIEKNTTRKLPSNHKAKWKKTIYDLAEFALPKSSQLIMSIGKYPESMYAILLKEDIMDYQDFDRLWPELHKKYPKLSGMPCDRWDDTFWANYDPVA